VERDVRELSEIGDTVKFTKFMVAAAAAVGQLLNLTALARDVGISVPTAERWLSVLVASNIVYLLPPYFNNITKRAIKTPKLYFLDSDENITYRTPQTPKQKYFPKRLDISFGVGYNNIGC